MVPPPGIALGSSPSLGTPPGAHLQGPGGHPVHDGGPLQAALLQLAQEDFVELLQVLGDGQVVVCWGRSGAQACPRTRRGSGGPAGGAEAPGLPSMTCRWPWMISSQRLRCCSRRRTASRRWRSAPSRSSACDCISVFSTSSSCTRHSRLSTSRCSSEPMRRGSVSSRRRPRARSSRQRCSSAPWGAARAQRQAAGKGPPSPSAPLQPPGSELRAEAPFPRPPLEPYLGPCDPELLLRGPFLRP